MKKQIVQTLLLLLTLTLQALAQQHTENKSDLTLRGSARVNPSTLGMEFEIPLGSYPGRGIDVPVSVSYSSKIWRLDYNASQPAVNNPDTCIAINRARFAENSASGWTTSMAVPYIEYVGLDNIYNSNGNPAGSDDPGCTPNTPPQYTENAWVRRISLHLPSGESHELRLNDSVLTYPPFSNCNDNDPQTPCDPNDPTLPANWNGWYFAVDGSNIRYFEDRTNNVYFVHMPDGSRYEFNTALGGSDSATIRKANKLVERNGNFSTFHEPSAAYPNGHWTDTIGRQIPVPFKPKAPAEPTVQTLALPGIGGSSVTYRFHWKRLKGNSPEESAITDFNAQLKFIGDKYLQNNTWRTRAAGQSLFNSEFEAWVVNDDQEFNPVVLAAVELPTGGFYRFGYNIFGEIELVRLPTGGEERFTMNTVGSITDLTGPNAEVNRGVTNRRVFESPTAQNPYQWEFSAQAVNNAVFKVTVKNPDGTRAERMLYRGFAPVSSGGLFGFENALAGMAFDERLVDASNRIFSKKLTTWAKTALPIANAGGIGASADWHPRVKAIETVTYDPSGNGVSATTSYGFENEVELNQPSVPVLTKSVSDFGFVNAGSGLSGTPIRTVKYTYLINDPSVPQTTRDIYRSANLVGLVSATELSDGSGNIVSRSETRFDEPGFSSQTGRGNATTSLVWNSTSGHFSNPASYIATRARFDADGNRVESIDARGNSTVTEYDPTYRMYPIRVTSPIPDPSGAKGSNTAFVSESTFDPATGLQLSGKDMNGLELRLEYDPATLRLLSSKTFFQNAQVGGVSETVYNDQAGNNWIKSRSQIDSNIWSERISYFDGLGREFRTEEMNSGGNIFVDKEFDSDGRLSRVSNPYRNGEVITWTTNEYDEASRIKKVILADGSTVATDWGVLMGDFTASTKTITDQSGKKRKGMYDSLGRLIRVIEDPDGLQLVTNYLFDAAGNIRKTVQGEQTRFFAFDSIGRLIYSKHAEQDSNPSHSYTDAATANTNWSTRYEYDPSGNIVKTTDPRGISVSATYDALSRMTKRDYSDATPDIDLYFDGTGLPVVPSNAKGKATRVSTSLSDSRITSFDPFGNPLSSLQTTEGRTYESAYLYNLSGQLVSETYPSGRILRNSLNANGQIESLTSQTANLAPQVLFSRVSYNSGGSVEKMRLGNGRWESTEYNTRQQITRVGLGFSTADRSLLDIGFGYGSSSENNGSVRSQTIKHRGLAEIRQSYQYDSLNRLTDAAESFGSNQQSWRQSFDYDPYGNRRYQTGTTTLSPTVATKVSNPLIQSHDNRLKRDQDGDNLVDFGYDPAGNLVLDAENKRFVFDAENRLKEFFKSDNLSSSPDAIYGYDGDGKRVLKMTAAEKTVFVYNAFGKLVAEYSTVVPSQPKTSYLTADHLGSPRVVTDGGGFVVSRHDYLAFGHEISDTVGNVGGRRIVDGYGRSDEIRTKYTGYERDSESGLDFAQARYYDAGHGRFTSVDPLTSSASLKDPQTFNRYSYALNSPYKFVDPLGLISSSTGANGGNSDNGPRKPRRLKPKTRQVPKGLEPNPNVVVPKNVQQEAKTSVLPAKTNPGGKEVQAMLPSSMVDLQTDLANFTYTQVGAATSQSVANSRFGSIQPEQVKVTETLSESSEKTESSETAVTAEVSQEPNLSVTSGSGSADSQSKTGTSELEVSGRSTDMSGVLNNVSNQTNLAITNYLNANSDANGMMRFTLVDQNNVRSRGVVHRDQVGSYLRDFVTRIRAQAYHDFGGR
ncbi:MAG: RHS repeat protein [Acidobacteria bacterium]|nr:RHS repeat protein [Acidobacteriota bacterium]